MKIPPVINSYLRAFLAAGLAVVLAGNTNPQDIVKAGLVAILPPLIRWLNPNDPSFGRGAE